MGKIYALIGKSGSGKSTIEKLLEKRGLKRIISTTTRPMREGEQEGIDYHYATEEEFEDGLVNGNYLEKTTYRGWHYGIDKNYNKVDLNNHDYICVTEPNGYRQIVNSLGKENVIGFYIWVDDKERLLRSLHREIKPDCKEICRRFLSDIELFSGFEEEVNYSIENNDIYKATDSIMNIINFQNTGDYRELLKGYNDDLLVGDKIKIKRILNTNKASHLERYINMEGYVFSWIIVDGKKKYKISFLDEEQVLDETAYFIREELELLER